MVKEIHPIDLHVGRRLRLARNAAGISQPVLAKKLGISFQQVQKYEQGSNRLSASRLHDIAKALGIKVTYFFEGVDSTETSPEAIFKFDKETVQAARLFQKVESNQTRRIVTLLLDDLAKHHSN